jgi:hypothetical protein
VVSQVVCVALAHWLNPTAPLNGAVDQPCVGKLADWQQHTLAILLQPLLEDLRQGIQIWQDVQWQDAPQEAGSVICKIGEAGRAHGRRWVQRKASQEPNGQAIRKRTGALHSTSPRLGQVLPNMPM